MLQYSLLSDFPQNSKAVSQTISNLLTGIENDRLNDFLCLRSTEELQQLAVTADNNIKNGTMRPLEGMIVAVKDNIAIEGMTLTCASKMLENYRPEYTATAVQRLVAAGSIILGKTNLDEFAMGSSGENSAFGFTEHPQIHGYVPGGSSSGSAAAVAAGHAHVAFGSDTGGSVRQPAALCGVVGFKPSYGRISRYGLVAFASSLDQIGILAPDVAAASMAFDAVSGKDPLDATSSELPPSQSYRKLKTETEKPKTIAVLPESAIEQCAREVKDAYTRCLAFFRSEGIAIIEAEIPASDAWIPTYYILATAEASSNLARYDGVRYGLRVEAGFDGDITTASRSHGFGAEVKRRIMLGTYVLSAGHYDAYYRKAQQTRRLISNGYASIFRQSPLLFLPTTPTTAFERGEKSKNPIEMYLSDYFTVSANLAGIPAISIQAGQCSKGLPIGMQLQAAYNDDENLLMNAHWIAEKLT